MRKMLALSLVVGLCSDVLAQDFISPIRTELQRLVKESNPNLTNAADLTKGSTLFRLQTLQGLAPELISRELVLRSDIIDTLTASVRIIGGDRAEPQEFPWQVALLHPVFGTIFCGGAHIGSGWILTAAHCLQNNTDAFVFYGSTNLVNNSARRIFASNPIIHPDWNPSTQHNDLALIRIPADASLASVRLANENEEAPPTVLRVSGWGLTTEGGSISVDLLKVEVPLVGKNICSSAYPGSIDDTQLCAGVTEKDSCQGDSGGPLSGWAAGSATLVGIVSFGRGCGRAGYPGVYTRVSYYLSWIKQVTNLR